MLKRNLIGFVCVLLLVGCGGDEAAAQKAVLGSLKDPASAKFGKFSPVGKKWACLTVNAKNSMGGYTGDQQAYLLKEGENSWFVIDLDPRFGHESCIEFFANT